MNPETTARLERSKVYVVYCDGIGCNASTKGAYKLARLGFRTYRTLLAEWSLRVCPLDSAGLSVGTAAADLTS
jgi:rhodanese-related sulfurtransferase